jgi:hypothetical protein
MARKPGPQSVSLPLPFDGNDADYRDSRRFLLLSADDAFGPGGQAVARVLRPLRLMSLA